jgi:predicted signal transduction protein with EAL and GGDEF domain
LLAENLRREIEDRVKELNTSVSIGVANFPRDAKDYESLIRAASAALYTAKEAGRNRVTLPPVEEMVMKTCYYTAASVARLKQIASSRKKKESELLREALDNLLREYDDLK